MWETPGVDVSAYNGEIRDDDVGYIEDLDGEEQRALAILAAVAYARRFAAESPSGGGG